MMCIVQLGCASQLDLSIFYSHWLQHKQIYLLLTVMALGGNKTRI